VDRILVRAAATLIFIAGSSLGAGAQSPPPGQLVPGSSGA
jgi:hypothetical protein